MKCIIIEKCRKDTDTEWGAKFKSFKEAGKFLNDLIEPEHWKIVKEQSNGIENKD